MQAILAARIDRLPAEDKRLLQAAAVIGKDVPFALLAAIAGACPRRAARAARPSAGRRSSSTRRGLFPDLEYTFKHALTHDVAYGSLLRSGGARCTPGSSTAIEPLYPERLAEHVERLAHHALRGEVWGKAVDYLLSAGRRALFASATREAVEHFERALLALRRLPPTPDTLRTAITLRLNLLDPLWSLGEVERIRDELMEAELVARQLDNAALGRVAAYRCQYLWSVGELGPALEAGEDALAIAVALNDALLLAETKLYQALVFLAQGDAQRAADLLSDSLQELDRRSGQRPGTTNRATVIRLLALSFLTRALAELGRFTEGIAYGEEALRLAEPNMAFGLATALAGLGILYVRKADAHTAIPLLERGLEASRTYSVTNWIPTLEATLGTAYVLAGRVEEGVVLLEHAVDLNRHTGIVATLSLWHTYLGDAYLEAGGSLRRGRERAARWASAGRGWSTATSRGRCTWWPVSSPPPSHPMYRTRTRTTPRPSSSPNLAGCGPSPSGAWSGSRGSTSAPATRPRRRATGIAPVVWPPSSKSPRRRSTRRDPGASAASTGDALPPSRRGRRPRDTASVRDGLD